MCIREQFYTKSALTIYGRAVKLPAILFPFLFGRWRLLFRMQCKYPRHVKAKVDIAFAPLANRFGNKAALYHRGRVGEMKLENVPAGFYIEPYR